MRAKGVAVIVVTDAMRLIDTGKAPADGRPNLFPVVFN